MELYIAGGCSEHGRNSFLVTGTDVSFLVDAGIMKEKPDVPYPELTEEEIRGVRYLFLTHCHNDHIGAVGWLIEHGFKGTIIGSRPTLQELKVSYTDRIELEDLAGPNENFRLDDDLKVMWGRSGHSIGSVWYRFRLEKRTILFTGDYAESSSAYRCDKIRGRKADLAVIDCAYGIEETPSSAVRHRKEFCRVLDEHAKAEKPMLFPVPSQGRGMDILRLLVERGIPVVIMGDRNGEFSELETKEFWLKKKFIKAMPALKDGNANELDSRLGIIVRDSQLNRDESRAMADAVLAKGGSVILTGKQDPASCARKLLNEGKAECHRISVHQNAAEMLKLASKNKFRYLIPYHSRTELTFEDERILVLHPEDKVHF